jgi:methionyl-tRNA formyltransferase
MNIIFFGNTKYSLIGAKIIHEALGLTQIVTIPDRPDKRGKIIPSPLKTFGEEKTIPVITGNKLDEDTIEQIKATKPDFFVVEDYGLILPSKLLTVPRYKSLNIHHSLLPKYRGTSPAPTALLNGDDTTGVTVIAMNDKIDAGAILAQDKYTIKPDDTTDSLLTILNQKGAEMLVDVIKNFDKIKPQPQDESNATFTKMMKKSDGFIDSQNPPDKAKLDRMIRAYFPWPGVWTRLNINGGEKIVKLLPGEKIQVEGKNPMSMKDFINGYPKLKATIEKLISSTA